MSLAALAKRLKPSTQFDRHPLSKQFSEKFPIITLDLEEMADRKVHENYNAVGSKKEKELEGFQEGRD